MAPVLAHYGGVPEVLTIALPIVIFTGFLLLEKRTRRKERERAAQGEVPQVDDDRVRQQDEEREAP